jgi:hypothetical protein
VLVYGKYRLLTLVYLTRSGFGSGTDVRLPDSYHLLARGPVVAVSAGRRCQLRRVAQDRFAEVSAPRQSWLWGLSLYPSPESDFRLLCHLQRIVHLNAQVPDRALDLAVSEQQLNGPQVLGALVDQRRLGPAHGMGSVARWVQS